MRRKKAFAQSVASISLLQKWKPTTLRLGVKEAKQMPKIAKCSAAIATAAKAISETEIGRFRKNYIGLSYGKVLMNNALIPRAKALRYT